MTDTARILLTAAVLAGLGLGVFAWRVMRTDPDAPDRLVGQLRLAQFAAIVLAVIAAMPVGLALASTGETAHVDAALGLAFAIIAVYLLVLDPREALGVAAAGFLAHALVDLAHRPGWLQADLAPRWYLVGCAMLNVYLASLCYLARRQ